MMDARMTTLPSFHTNAPLDRTFYERPTLDVARELIGALLVHNTEKARFSGVIVETEAYIAPEDAACHAYRGVTPRNRVMFGPAGHAYVYRSYGIHDMLNVVTEPAGVAAAVLIRAVAPCEGFDGMLDNRGLREPRQSKGVANVTNGPGRLCQAFDIGPELNGADLTGLTLYITAGGRDSAHDTPPIVQTTRIGITRAIELPWRFYVRGNPHVSVRDRKAEVVSS